MQVWNILGKINWPTAIFIHATLFLGLYGLFTTTIFHKYTLILALIWFYKAGLGITMGECKHYNPDIDLTSA
jgi:hypothetical protein